ncbi:MAG: DUF4184 family protein, partial [Candidatus Omnitrophica bacterium]|nr:DUF4184 family protein [Candidatus Omnitrophota bacterium]
MPVTPFHLGPGFLVKETISKFFSFRIFLLTQFIIDFEALYFILLNQFPLHRIMHTFLGSSFVAVFCVILGRPICVAITKRWNSMFDRIESFRVKEIEITRTSAVVAALFGCYTHVLLDAIMHSDVIPFYPFMTGNPFLHIVNHETLHKFCIYTGLFGFTLYSIGRIRNEKVKNRLRKFLKIIVVLAGIAVLGLILIMYLIFGRGHSSFDDGPFIGEEYTRKVTGVPSSGLRLNDGLYLEVYNRTDEETPIMVLRDNEGEVKWAKLLTVSNVENFQNASVARVQLMSFNVDYTGY